MAQKNPPGNPLLMSQLIVQNTIIEYLMCCFPTNFNAQQIDVVEQSISTMVKDRVREEIKQIAETGEQFDNAALRNLSNATLKGTMASVRAYLAEQRKAH